MLKGASNGQVWPRLPCQEVRQRWLSPLWKCGYFLSGRQAGGAEGSQESGGGTESVPRLVSDCLHVSP